jgi:hypothetical protein
MYCDSAINMIRAIDVAQQSIEHFGCIVGEFPRSPFAEPDERQAEHAACSLHVAWNRRILLSTPSADVPHSRIFDSS